MSQSLRTAPAPVGAADLFHWIGTKNPFYAISAALVLSGLWVSFGKPAEPVDTWLLMTGLAGYTMLLAVTAFALVRYLDVWDDARTVLLLVVLLFLATSVTFDPVLAVDPGQGALCYIFGLVLSVAISEAMLRGIRLRLPWLYRLPYYFLLALFFLYPVLVRRLLDPQEPMAEPVLWGLFGFSTAAALVFLTLLPALRRGADYVGDNGPHLIWPVYPWCLFVVFAVAVPGRAILLCWSLHALDNYSYDRLIFGPYFLVPFGFALGVLVLEMGLVLRRRGLLVGALVVPLLLMGLALVGHKPSDPVYRLLRVLTVPIGLFSAFGEVRNEPDPVYGEFLRIFSARLGGDPLFVTLILTMCFYAYALVRRVPLAAEALLVAVAAKAVIGRHSLSTGPLQPVALTPLLAAGVVFIALGLRRRDVFRMLLGAGLLATVVALDVRFPDRFEPGLRSELFVHVLVLAMLVIGATYADAKARALRFLAALSVLVLSFAGMYNGIRIPALILPSAAVTYPLFMGVLLGLYAHWLRHSFSMKVAAVILGYWVFKFGWSGYRAAHVIFRGLHYLVPGLAFFAVAVLVSLGKSGLLRRWIEPRWGWGLPPWLLAPALQPLPAGLAEVPAPSPLPQPEGAGTEPNPLDTGNDLPGESG